MKINFFKKTLILGAIALLLVLSSAFGTKEKTENRVLIYGIVYTQECNSESYQYFSHELVDAGNYPEKQKELESRLWKAYPNAKKIKMGSSKYDYGGSATNMCVIQWEKEGRKGCFFKVISISFGKSQTEADNKAIEKKNTWAGIHTSHSIIEQKYW